MIPIQKTSQFQCPATKAKSIPIQKLKSGQVQSPTLKSSQFRPPTQKPSEIQSPTKMQENSTTEIISVSIPTPISSRFRCSDVQIALTSVHTLETSHLRLLHTNQVISDIYTEIKSIPTTHTITKSISRQQKNHVIFVPCYITCYTYARVHVPVTRLQYVPHKYEHYLVLFLACPYDSKTPRIWRSMLPYVIFYYSYSYMHGI